MLTPLLHFLEQPWSRPQLLSLGHSGQRIPLAPPSRCIRNPAPSQLLVHPTTAGHLDRSNSCFSRLRLWLLCRRHLHSSQTDPAKTGSSRLAVVPVLSRIKAKPPNISQFPCSMTPLLSVPTSYLISLLLSFVVFSRMLCLHLVTLLLPLPPSGFRSDITFTTGSPSCHLPATSPHSVP